PQQEGRARQLRNLACLDGGERAQDSPLLFGEAMAAQWRPELAHHGLARAQERAQRLHRAEKARQQIRQLSLDFPGMTIEDAYAIQTAWIAIKRAEGRIGLTSKAMQSALNIDEPDSGVLLDDIFFADGGLAPSERFIATRVEAELTFVMGKRLSG